jgi:hypothetical protein
MATTLTFALGIGPTPTATGEIGFFNDMVTMINNKLGDASFSWKVLSSNVASSPYYVVLGRKDNSAGRILLIDYLSSPAGYNPSLFDSPTVTTDYCQVAYFPNGNVSTPSNLTSNTGAVMGNDTGVVKLTSNQTPITSMYNALTGTILYYFDSYDFVSIGVGNAYYQQWAFIGGKCLVDYTGTAYDGCMGSIIGTSQNSALMQWCPSTVSTPAGLATYNIIRTNYGSNNRAYFSAFPNSAWLYTANGTTGDILADNSNSKAWFAAYPLMGQTKGEGVVLKLRQMAWGPSTNVAFQEYSVSGPTVAAISANNSASGSTTSYSNLWFTNFQV